MGQAGRPSSPYPALPCITLPILLSPVMSIFGILCREIMHKSLESIQRAMRRDQPKTPEHTRGTLPNTDQPRIPHPEYHHIWRHQAVNVSTLSLRDLLPGALFSPRQALLALHRLHFYFFSVFFLRVVFVWLRLLPFNILSSSQ